MIQATDLREERGETKLSKGKGVLMSPEVLSELPPEYKDLLWIFATSKIAMVNRASEEYQVEFAHFDPINEPKKGRSRWPAVAKNNRVALPILRQSPATRAMVVSADVSFEFDGEKQHRADREGKLSQKKLIGLQDKAVKRYSRPHTGNYDVTFVTNDLQTEKRLATFSLTVSSKTGFPEDEIRRETTAESNAMIPLVELGTKHGASFTIRQKESKKEVVTSPKVAEMLVAYKILPVAAMAYLLQAETEYTYVDRIGQKWEIPAFNVKGLFGIPRE